MGLLQRIMLYVWGAGIVLLALFIVFVRRLKTLASREQNTVYQSIIGTWIVIVCLWMFINFKSIVIEPISLKALIISFHSSILRDGILIILVLISVFQTMRKYKR